MNTHYTEIAFVLDESGSMRVIQEAALRGFNDFLLEQQQVEGLARLTLLLFNHSSRLQTLSVPVAEVTPQDSTTYMPRGRTALLDAIGDTVTALEERLMALPEQELPGQVIVAILTDGLENSSRRYTWEQIAGMIAKRTSWQFFFLGANQDAIATAARMSIVARQAARFTSDVDGIRSSQSSLSRKISSLRRTAAGKANEQERTDASSSLSDIVEDENRKQRKRTDKP